MAGRGRWMLRRAACAAAALALAVGGLATGPRLALASETQCDAVTLTSPAALQVHVGISGCGAGSTPGLYAGTVLLSEHRSGIGIGSWLVDGFTTSVDATIAVPAAGSYDLVVHSMSTAGETYQSASATVADGGLVTITRPFVGYRTGKLTSTMGVMIDWAKIGSGAVSKYQVQRSLDGAAFAFFATASTSQANATVRVGHRYEFRVRAVTAAGTPGPWRSTGGFEARASQENNGNWTFAGGTWTTSSGTSWWGGHARTASRAGRTATLRAWGSAVAIVAAVGPTRGSMRVYVDGAYRTTVSLHRSATAYRQIVYSIWWPVWGDHTVQLRVVGTAGHPRVDVDGAMIIDVSP
jgi:hypothetical protein